MHACTHVAIMKTYHVKPMLHACFMMFKLICTYLCIMSACMIVSLWVWMYMYVALYVHRYVYVCMYVSYAGSFGEKFNFVGCILFTLIVKARSNILTWHISRNYQQHTVYIQIFKRCKFQGFVVNWLTMKFSSSKFYWQNFQLHQLERKLHLNSNVWHFQMMIASFNLSRCNRRGNLQTDLPPNSTFSIHSVWPYNWIVIHSVTISMHQTRDKRVCHQCGLLNFILDRSR